MEFDFDIKKYQLLSQRQRMSPFPNYMSMECVCKEMKKYVGAAISNIILLFNGRVMTFFGNTEIYNQTGRAIADRVHKEPGLYAKLTKRQEKVGKKLVNFTKKAHKAVNDKTTNQQLYEYYKTYEKLYKDVYASYGSIWVMEDHLNKDLLEIIEKKIKKDPKKAVDILNTLTKQPSAMVARIERKAFLELAIKVTKNDEFKKLIENKNIKDIKANKELAKLINQHVKEYFWVTRDYEDPILDFETVVERLKKSIDKDNEKELKELIDKLNDNEKMRKQYLKELKLTKNELALFDAMREAAHLKELRKRYVSESLYHFDKVLIEIGKRLYMSIKQIRFMRTLDIQKALIKNEDLEEEINKRMKLSLWYTKDGTYTEVETDQHAKEIYDLYCGIDENAKEFTGMPVSPGIAKGPAKIVMDPNECDKVNEGDIIVSVQVVPSFSTAIIKSAGIVCDGGHGITSHPATLAREAGIPCIIQTQFARKVIKDGDIVEVDGYKGTARIVERK